MDRTGRLVCVKYVPVVDEFERLKVTFILEHYNIWDDWALRLVTDCTILEVGGYPTHDDATDIMEHIVMSFRDEGHVTFETIYEERV